MRGSGDLPPDVPLLPAGVLCVRFGSGANCSSAGSAIDVLFYGSVLVGALAVALGAALPPASSKPKAKPDPPPSPGPGDGGDFPAPPPSS